MAFEPITNITLVLGISLIEFVIAPDPNDMARPATVGACQVRGAVIDIIGADHRAHKFLHQIIFFVGTIEQNLTPQWHLVRSFS